MSQDAAFIVILIVIAIGATIKGIQEDRWWRDD